MLQKLIGKGLVILILGSFIFLGHVYVKMIKDEMRSESLTDLKVKYQKSVFAKLVLERHFDHLAERYPKTVSFLVGLDPRVSKNSNERWFLVFAAGWTYFSLFSPAAKAFCELGNTRWQLFLSPIGFLVIPLLVYALGAVISIFSEYGRFVQTAGEFIANGMLIILFAIGVLSIPIAVFCWTIKMLLGSFRVLEPLIYGAFEFLLRKIAYLKNWKYSAHIQRFISWRKERIKRTGAERESPAEEGISTIGFRTVYAKKKEENNEKPGWARRL